ncbi:unnamed protein product, partial [Musa acuminata subsp. burmannicoides]
QDVKQKVQDLRGGDHRAHLQAPVSSSRDPPQRRKQSKPTNAVLKETCNYIKSLHREVDDLSDRLSELMATMDVDSAQAEIVRSLFRS